MTKPRLLITATCAAALLALPASAMAADTDHDGMPDGWEKTHHLSPTTPNAKKDPDGDGLRNIGEFRHHTRPHDADTDNDSLRDAAEVRLGDNPNDADTDDDGIRDGDELGGTVQHFDSATGTLTILLADGTTTRSGRVTQDTVIKCEDESAETGAAKRGGADDPANHDATDDNGGTSGSGTDDGTGGHGELGHGGRSSCTTADLTDGRVVHEAKLVSDGNGGFTFRKVELDG